MKEQFQARMLRIHFGEGDKWHGKPLHEAILAKCVELGMQEPQFYRVSKLSALAQEISSCEPLTFSKDAPDHADHHRQEERIAC